VGDSINNNVLMFSFLFNSKEKKVPKNLSEIKEDSLSLNHDEKPNIKNSESKKIKQDAISETDEKKLDIGRVIMTSEEEDEIALRKFWNRLDAIDKKKQNVFLMLGGSFNPVHKEHIQIMEIARRYCEKNLGMAVVAGFLGVSSANHVTRKLGLSKAITLNHRNEMCDLAVEASDWISVCPWGWANASNSASRLLRAIRKKDKRINIIFFNVMGSDIFGDVMPEEEGFYDWWRYMKDYICVNRDQSKVFEAVKKLGNTDKSFHFADESTSGSVSSTLVRELVEANDYNRLEQYLDAKVITYLKQNVKHIWEATNTEDVELFTNYNGIL